ncbi:hypothetical protein CO051_01690 [Candidatus Roizmanbacteria bacterium CG_4_9_14_0_2_um_filter_39_13]|uniref:Uncharacterized protein n=1 Tax=Candidatus Roizmanbacteria bacterium CG_4_9_14_0_2_um_filter_39_13 TaxID=1974839 RepID=A0A2M8F1Z0_9BACT|nr:MAG: hypothetical protein COY15_01300 [Candidatus Roizmanbacteria bacterium CG_4_10_14_0_2_um_filter_39_12]PJC33309.1 MAG: hypothetical protein CO051_01690 [Candidatus Roizmanbacteria bacterium CG_4_9_14_0_2_um_filter_39_13]
MDSSESSQTIDPALAENPLPEHKSLSKMIFILGGIIFLVLGLLIGYYFSQSSKTATNSQATPSPTLSPGVSDEMEGWKTYDKRFADVKYFFRYPAEYEINDNDPDSGSIYLSKIGTRNYPIYLTINTISNSGWPFTSYISGSRRVWVQDNLEKQYPNKDFSTLTFKEVDYADGKSYLFISGFPEDTGRNRYIGIQNEIPITIGDSGLMPVEEISKILSTLSVIK